MTRALAAILLAGLALAACAGESENGGGSPGEDAQRDPPTPVPRPKPGCRPAPQALVGALQATLTADAGELRQVRYVTVEGAPADPPLSGFRGGLYVVSGQVGSSGVRQLLTWAVGRDMLRTGSGAGLPLDSNTRESSDLGAAAEGSRAELYTPRLRESAAYDSARACAGGA